MQNEKKIKKYTRQLKEGKITLPEIQRSIAGWLGYVKHADSYNLRKCMFYIEGQTLKRHSYRVIRGGNYNNNGNNYPVAYRNYNNPNNNYNNTGFRATL